MCGQVFSGSAAISDIVIIEDSEGPDNIEISLSINDIFSQPSKCAQMIWSVEEIIFLLSQTIPLFPGDLIYTGTPSGVGKIKKGDRISATLLQKNSTPLSFDLLYHGKNSF
jgi:2-keto-4-pentenoate hydratase/2-oxohepta-3-ene-1,7-dioic acid hydratase (catechol pathway)